MIRVTIEMLPHGFEENKRTIGTIEIANDGSGTLKQGNYVYKMTKDPALAKKPGIWRSGKIFGFDRVKKGCYDLLWLVLKDAVEERNIRA